MAEPELVSARCAPPGVVGIGIERTSVPVGVYSSTNVAVAPLVSAAAPVPTRTTRMLPGTTGVWADRIEAIASGAITERAKVNMVFLKEFEIAVLEDGRRFREG